jgi:hypothetical protein
LIGGAIGGFLMALAYDHFLYPPQRINTFVAAARQLAIWEG